MKTKESCITLLKRALSLMLAVVVLFASQAGFELEISAEAATEKAQSTAKSSYVMKQKSAGATSLRLSWSKTKGATGYRLYMYSSEAKKWKKVVTTSATSYTVKKLKAGTIYKFRVRAYKKSGKKVTWGKYYEALNATTDPQKMSALKSSDVTDKQMKISWSKVSGATGYRLYRYNTASKQWEKVKTTSATSFTVKNLKANTSYKFRARAYKKFNGKIFWSAASEELTAKTKKAIKTFNKPIGVYESKNLPSEHFIYDDRCAAWISVYTVGKSDKAEKEIKSRFKKVFGYTAQENVKCTYKGEYYVKGYSGAQKVYQYTIEDYTYPLIVDEFYELSYSICADGSPWVGFCVPMENYGESEKAQKLLSEIQEYFYEISGYSEEYVEKNKDSFSWPHNVIWSGPYRTKDGKIIDQITWIFIRGTDVPFNKDTVCPDCGESVTAGEIHEWKDCKLYNDTEFRKKKMQELVK